MQKPQEIWLPAAGFEDTVQVSNIGRVRTVNRTRAGTRPGRAHIRFIPGKVLGQFIHTSGYKIVVFVINGKRKQVYVHRMVALAFVGGDKSLSVNHINGKKHDNQAENLEWCSLADNTRKQWADGLCNARGERNGQSKFKAEQILAIRRLTSSGASQTDIAIVAGVVQAAISFIANGKRWSALSLTSHENQ